MEQFRRETIIGTSACKLENWDYAPGAFRRIAPPVERMQIIEEPSEVADGARMAINAGPVWTEWTAEHRNCIPGESFIDVQVEGPFTSWKHKHEFHAIKSASSMIYTFNRRWGSSETISGEK